MDIFFRDPNEVPLPPEEVRIHQLSAEVNLDGRRVRIYLEVDPFQKRPSVDLAISDDEGNPIAHASVIESMTRKIEITMHLRGEDPHGPFTLEAVLYYQSPPAEPEEPSVAPQLDPPQVVDRQTIIFDLS